MDLCPAEGDPVTRRVKTYTGEVVRAETGDEGTYATQSMREVIAKIRSLNEGDALTINVDMQDAWGDEVR